VRRIGLGSSGAPPSDALVAAAQIAATELGWDAARMEAEMTDVRRFYEIG
jgi:hypothetical protein